MKARGIRLPLWLQIILCPIGIGLISTLLVICFGKDWFPAIAYLVAATALAVGVCVAYHHLRIIQGTERASVLTDLDVCWGGAVLEKSRLNFLELDNEIKKIENKSERKRIVMEKLRSLKEKNPPKYRSLIDMIGFLETIAYFCRAGYILLNDALELYGPAIRQNDGIFRGHILERQKEDRDKWLFSNFIWLADEAKLTKN